VEQTSPNNDESQGPLAEYVALREELVYCLQNLGQILTLQLTAAGAILSLVVTQAALRGLALIVPLLSYALLARAVSLGQRIRDIATYVRDNLSQRIPGGLRWEDWIRQRTKRDLFLTLSGRFLTFPGVSFLALGWAFGFVFLSPSSSAMVKIGLATVWTLGLCGTIFQSHTITRGQYAKIRPRRRPTT
jgi:hypothetical protein